MGIFEKSKSSTQSKKTNSKEKTIIDIDSIEFFDSVKKLETISNRMKKDKSESEELSEFVKSLSLSAWSRMYSDDETNPGTVIVQTIIGDETAQSTFMPQDKYIKIDEKKANELRSEFSDEIVTEVTEFKFDNDMLEKYGDILSKLIEECVDIEDSDKDKIVIAETTFSVSKGTIDKMSEFGDVQKVFEKISPVVTSKDFKVIKG